MFFVFFFVYYRLILPRHACSRKESVWRRLLDFDKGFAVCLLEAPNVAHIKLFACIQVRVVRVQ